MENLEANRKAAERLFESSLSVFASVYNQQMKMFSDYFGSIFRFTPEPGTSGFAFPFSILPNGTHGGNPVFQSFLTTFEKNAQQLAELNKSVFERLQESQKIFFDKDLYLLNERYQKVLETRFDLAQKVYELTMVAFNQQLDFARENNKKLLEEINAQFDKMNTEYKDFWLEAFSSLQPDTRFSPAYRERTSSQPKTQARQAVNP